MVIFLLQKTCLHFSNIQYLGFWPRSERGVSAEYRAKPSNKLPTHKLQKWVKLNSWANLTNSKCQPTIFWILFSACLSQARVKNPVKYLIDFGYDVVGREKRRVAHYFHCLIKFCTYKGRSLSSCINWNQNLIGSAWFHWPKIDIELVRFRQRTSGMDSVSIKRLIKL